jgi:hypothetical protein
LPAVLFAAAAISLDFGTEGAFAVSAFLTAAVGVTSFADLLFGHARINCAKTLAIGLTLGYGLTSFNTWWSVYDDPGGLSAFVGVARGPLCEAIAAVATASGLLFVVGEALRRDLKLDVSAAARSPQARWFVLTAFAVVAAAFLSGGLSYMGLQGGMGAVSLLGWIGGWLLAPLFGMTIAVVAREEDGPLRVLFWTLFAAEIVLAVPLGRRVFLFTMFIGGLTVRLAHVWRRRVVLKRVAAVAVGVCGMYLASIVFLYIRAANYELDLDRQASLSVLLDKAYELHEKRSVDEMQAVLKDNTLRRGFIIDFLAELLDGTQRHGTANGRDIANAATGEIPALFWKDKAKHLPMGEEDLAGQIFGTQFPDSATSVLTGGALDFGFVGAVLYPLAAALLMTVFLDVLARVSRPVTSTVVSLAGLYVMLDAQAGAGESIAFIRNTMLYILILHVISWLRPGRPGWRDAARPGPRSPAEMAERRRAANTQYSNASADPPSNAHDRRQRHLRLPHAAQDSRGDRRLP